MSEPLESYTRKQTRVSLKDKLIIIDMIDIGWSYREIAKKFNISAGSVSYIHAQREKYISMKKIGYNEGIKKIPARLTFDCDLKIKDFIENSAKSKLPVDNDVIKTVARETYQENGCNEFKGSKGYFKRFQDRLLVKNIKSNENASFVKNLAIHKWILQCLPIISEYSQVDIFNMDETALFLKKPPENTFNINDKINQVPGSKVKRIKSDKARVTIVCACSLTGYKEKLTIIYKNEKPRAFHAINFNYSKLPVNYIWDPEAKMTSDAFKELITNWDNELSTKGRKILLFLDDTYGQYIGDHTPKSIKFFFLEPNSISKVQPFSGGILKSFEDHYVTRYTDYLNGRCRDNLNVNLDDLCKQFDILKAIRMAHLAWNDVDKEMILNCWSYFGLGNCERQSNCTPALSDHNY